MVHGFVRPTAWRSGFSSPPPYSTLNGRHGAPRKSAHSSDEVARASQATSGIGTVIATVVRTPAAFVACLSVGRSAST